MKLAEALQERAELNSRINSIRERLADNIIVQDGDMPAEDPNELRVQLENTIKRLAYIMYKINMTNCMTVVGSQSLTEIIAEKDALKLSCVVYKASIRSAGSITYRVRSSDIRLVQTINTRDWQNHIDEISGRIRELDAILQKTNWTVDLIE